MCLGSKHPPNNYLELNVPGIKTSTQQLPGTQCAWDFECTSPNKLHHFQMQLLPHFWLAAIKPDPI